MLEQRQINKIKEAIEEFFEKMTISISSMEVSLSSVNSAGKAEQPDLSDLSKKNLAEKNSDNLPFEIFSNPKNETSKAGLSEGVKKDSHNEQTLAEEEKDVVSLDIKLDEPQILIGQGGQTLFEIQRLLRTILNKKLQKAFYFNLDINDYKKKKIEYLKDLAKDLADQVALTKKEKAFPPMSSYERRIIHSELSSRTDIVTESQGEGFNRCVVIKPC